MSLQIANWTHSIEFFLFFVTENDNNDKTELMIPNDCGRNIKTKPCAKHDKLNGIYLLLLFAAFTHFWQQTICYSLAYSSALPRITCNNNKNYRASEKTEKI